MSKPKNKVRVSFPSPASEHVTGSMTLVESSNRKILLDCGLYQCSDMKEQYQINNRKFKFKPKDIDYVFIGHIHADHSLLLPRLIKEGFHGRIIVPIGFSVLFPIMAADSLHIMERDLKYLNKKNKTNIHDLYSEEDVQKTLSLVTEYDTSEKFTLDDELAFQFYDAGHIINSVQIKLWIKEGNQVKTIGYTSDIGNTTIDQYYSGKFDPIEKVNCLIGECTYSRQMRDVTKKDRQNDLNKMHDIITEVCVNTHHRVLIPSFSLSRSQNIITHLYDIFHEDPSFDIPVLVDSRLTISLCQAYLKLLPIKEKEEFEKVLEWKNIKLISDYKDSLKYQDSNLPCVIVASSGMMTAGRSVQWAKKVIPNSGDHILFVGYSSEGSLADVITTNKKKYVTIDKYKAANRCKFTQLLSFSSHADKKCLKRYYSMINTEKVCLVHSEQKSKILFAEELREAISNNNKTTKIVAVNGATSILV
ncbi:MAG: MBL fold metallo-hydrolase [Bacteroidales bacterium]